MGATGLDIKTGLENFQPFPGRLEHKPLPGPIHLLDDTYNANPLSTRAAMNVLMKNRGRGRIVAVLGDMLELGRASKMEHTLIGLAAAEKKLDLLVAVGPESKAMAREALRTGLSKSQVVWLPDSQEAAAWLPSHVQKHDRILVKGSRGMHMEVIVKQLCGEEIR